MPRRARNSRRYRQHHRDEAQRLLQEGLAAQPTWLLKKLGLEGSIPALTPPPSRGHPGYSTRPVPADPLITSPSKFIQATTLHRPFDPRNEDYWGRLKEVPSLSLVPGQARLPAKENLQGSPVISAGVPPTLCADDEGRADSPVQEDSRENIPPSWTKSRETPPTPGKNLAEYIAQRKIIRGGRGAIPLRSYTR